MSDVTRAVQRMWPGQDVQVEVLGGGITNQNLKVDVGGESFVLRVAGKNTDLLGINREAELAATEAAAAARIGPEVVGFVLPEGWLVTRFLEGATPPMERMREPAMLRRVADALYAFHAGPAVPATFDSFRVVEAYRQTTLEWGGAVPDAYDWAHEIAGRIEARRSADAHVPCHNDLLNANFLFDGERLRIVDWEYAGMGDRFFDLANFAINHELDEAASEALLTAYVGEVRPEDARALALMRFMSDFREAMWGVVQSAVSELDFDFVTYASDHFERLHRTAGTRAFAAALEE
jgi:thiamine kinase-like enzyme